MRLQSLAELEPLLTGGSLLAFSIFRFVTKINKRMIENVFKDHLNILLCYVGVMHFCSLNCQLTSVMFSSACSWSQPFCQMANQVGSWYPWVYVSKETPLRKITHA
jgi:hypothetical protein